MANTSVSTFVGLDDLRASTWGPHSWALIAGDVTIYVRAPASTRTALLAALDHWREAVQALPDDETDDEEA